ncbi:MAG: RNA-binding domain-containing protein [Parachlamydiales bacterium]|jgi:ATP-dependent DNA helicase RecG
MKYPESESSTIEWKGSFPEKEQIVKTIVGFCNRFGGKLIIGVSNNGDIVGIDESMAEEQMEHLDKMIYESTAPPIIPLVHTQRIGDKVVLLIEVSSGMNKPYYIKSMGMEKGVFVRLGRSTMKANVDMIEELKWSSRGLHFDLSSLYHSSANDLDMDAIENFFSLRKGKKKSFIDTILVSFNIINEEHKSKYPTVTGVLVFGKRPEKHLPEAFIICSRFSGVSGRNAIASQDCVGTLFEQFEMAFAFILKHLHHSFVIREKKREEKLEIPEVAIRETLLNAIVHRNYHIRAPIKIAIYDNRIEIFSPGDFPGPINTSNLLSGLTYIRNPGISKIFRQAKYIEKLGSGFHNLFDSYENWGLVPPEVIEGENYIKCILPREKQKALHGKDSINEEEKILNLFNQTEEITISDVISSLGIARATAGRRLNGLVKAFKLKQIGSGKSTSYRKVNK